MTNNFIFQGQTRRKGEKIRPDGTPVESEWVTGCGVFVGEHDYSIIYYTARKGSRQAALVYSDTIRQSIGLTDKNGKIIFNGDIGKSRISDNVYVVRFYDAGFHIEDKYGNAISTTYEAIDHLEFEVIGNIWDNPELLEKNDNA